MSQGPAVNWSQLYLISYVSFSHTATGISPSLKMHPKTHTHTHTRAFVSLKYYHRHHSFRDTCEMNRLRESHGIWQWLWCPRQSVWNTERVCVCLFVTKGTKAFNPVSLQVKRQLTLITDLQDLNYIYMLAGDVSRKCCCRLKGHDFLYSFFSLSIYFIFL